MNILIIGCGQGLGYECLKQFASEKSNNILAASKNIVPIQQLKSLAKINTFKLNLEKAENIESLFKYINKINFRPELFLFNSGILIKKEFCEFDFLDTNKIFQINFFSFAHIVKLLILRGKPYPKHILSISSMSGFQSSAKFPGMSMYGASKAALVSLTESLSEEYKEIGIKFNTLALGAIQTEMLKSAFPEYKAPLDAKEMSEFVVWFALNGYKFMNGKVLPISLTTP